MSVLKSIAVFILLICLETAIQAQKECLLLSTAPTLGTRSSFAVSDGSFSPDEIIDSIQVSIETNGGIFSGDTDDVWLDIGPRAWKIGDNFGAGTTITTALSAADINNSYFQLSGAGKLRVKDIAYIRLEKKGICGLTDAPDSLLDLLFPGGATPANLLPSARAEIEKAQAAIGLANDGLALHKKAIEAEQNVINDIDAKLNQLNSLKSTAEKTAIDLNSALIQKQHDIESGSIKHFESVVEHFSDEVCASIAKFTGLCLAKKLVDKTRVVQHVTQTYSDAQQFIVNQQAKIATVEKQVVDLQTSITNTASEKAAHMATLSQMLEDKTAEADLAKASKTLTYAKEYARQLDDLAQQALAGLSVPQPGQWNLHSVTVAVNGKKLTSFLVDRRLKRHASSVQFYLRSLTPDEEFNHGLRANVPQEQDEKRPNKDELVAGITTQFFKDNGISGWEGRPLTSAAVIGILRHRPSPGTDNFVSFDLELQEVEARGRFYSLSSAEVPRFIRIEYNNVSDTRYLQWPVGTRIYAQ